MFKRSRRIAKRLVLCIWLLPLVIWVPVQVILFEIGGSDKHDGSCLSLRQNVALLPLIAIPVLYIPAITLVSSIRVSPPESPVWHFYIFATAHLDCVQQPAGPVAIS